MTAGPRLGRRRLPCWPPADPAAAWPAAPGCWPRPPPASRPAPTPAGRRTPALGGFTVSSPGRGRHRPVRAAQLSRSRPRRRSSSTRATPSTVGQLRARAGSATGLEPLPGPGGGQRRPRARAAGAGRAPAAGARSGPSQAASEYPQTPNTASRPTKPGVNMDASEHGQRQHGHAPPSATTRATAGVERRRPDAQAPVGLGQPARRLVRPRRRRHHVGHLVVVGAQHDGRRRHGHARPTAASPCSAASSPSARVTSTATATSDGTTGKVTGSTRGSEHDHRRRAGHRSTPTGSQAAGKATPLAAAHLDAQHRCSSELGHLACRSTNATDTVSRRRRPAGRSTGLKISIDLKTLDTAANQLSRRCCPRP